MPDLERRITDTLDRLGDRPDPARILERVARRKNHFRLVHRAQTITLVVAVLVGVAGGMYALGRAFGIGTYQPVPNSSSHPAPSPVPSHPSPTPVSPTPTVTATPVLARCAGGAAQGAVDSQNGAAGTMSTTWRVTNLAAAPCRAFGYPDMEFHTTAGWLHVQVQHGGYPNISQPPTHIEVVPGGSMFFVSYWSDVVDTSGPCQQFDRVRITLPGDSTPIEVSTSGCVTTDSVRAGPMVKKRPA